MISTSCNSKKFLFRFVFVLTTYFFRFNSINCPKRTESQNSFRAATKKQKLPISKKSNPANYCFQIGTKYYLLWSKNLEQNAKYRVKIDFQKYTKFQYFALDTNDIFSFLCFPFSANIVAFMMFPVRATDEFEFTPYVKAVVCVNEISRTLYKKTGFLHNALNFGYSSVHKEISTDLLIQYFVPSFFAYIDQVEISIVEPLLPYIGDAMRRVSRLPYFKEPLKGIRPFLAKKFNIHFEIINEVDNEAMNNETAYGTAAPIPSDISNDTDNDSSDTNSPTKITMTLIQTVYHQLGQQSHPKFNAFFQSFWQEICIVHDSSSDLMRQFYTLKFVEIIDEMAGKISINLEIALLDNFQDIFTSFTKLKLNVVFSKFIAIVIPIDNLKVNIKRVIRLIKYLDSNIKSSFESSTTDASEIISNKASSLSNEQRKSLSKDFIIFLDQFLHFLVFYEKYSIQFEYRKFFLKKFQLINLLQHSQNWKSFLNNYNHLY